MDEGLKSIFQQNLTPTNFVLPTFQSTLRWSQRLQRLLYGGEPNSPSERNAPMIQCLAEKRADVNYRITVTRQIVRPPRKVDVVLSCCRKRIPALIVALIQKAIMLSLSKLHPRNPGSVLAQIGSSFSFCPKGPNANLRTVNQSLYVQLRASMTLATTRRKPCGCG